MSVAGMYRRIRRRESSSSRSRPAVVIAVLLALVAVWLSVEIVLGLVGAPPLLRSARQLARDAVALAAYPAGTVIAVGALVAALGLVLVILALAPGRRARHGVDTDGALAIVDDEVIGSALAREAAHAGRTDPDNVRVTLSRRRALVHLTPTSGFPPDRAAVAAAVAQHLDGLRLHPRMTSRVVVDDRGRVGA